MLRKELARHPITSEKMTADSIDYGSGKRWKMMGLVDCLAVGAGYGPGRKVIIRENLSVSLQLG